MAFAWKSAGISYLKYSQICARVVRDSLKADKKAAAQVRNVQDIKFAKWQGGKAGESAYIVPPKTEA
ncbi:mitochondrial ATP synthase epsilon chain domain-containing protein [Conidiobolus coronatus NRRL 28638]|uniref:Mitochondrial ATP synthase epsilon chain domain-containing protein n=1 Tax=Conidiobolus coronatus (strain ATCC 28846 / CBS 209.66 / NRRL 28638) TaxID=796925 RepID=A0A137P5M1_CONC2|nr:mitochondrial ATP synthase epsilon chain domain-containing protein [Conidiobolus coronatus NRRL 28638]|eukprot:KXN70306.1 mitochondrial ATP synthase epsilon chain domain-containing protein [Conidiobolus coronatus NRRL 28638]